MKERSRRLSELGDPFLVPEDGHLTIANRKIAGAERMLYTVRLTDIYQAHYLAALLETWKRFIFLVFSLIYQGGIR